MTSEPVGSLGEEAAKLVAVLQGWAQKAGARDADDLGDEPLDESLDDEPHEHGHGRSASECRYCPLCAVARSARSMTPEVREHLATAAVSLALAFKGFLDDIERSPREESPVEKIDLAED